MKATDAVKAMCKRIEWVALLNARIKSAKAKRVYAQTRAYYALKPVHASSESLHVRSPFVPSPCRIFFLGTDESQDRSGILSSLSRLGQLTYFTRADGSYGQNHPGPVQERRRTNSDRLLSLFAHANAEGNAPAILISQTWAGYVDPQVLGYIRKTYGTMIVNIAMDDRHQYWGERVKGEWWGTRGLIPYLDFALTAAPECIDWYLKEGCPAAYFPEASDPAVFHPMPDLPKINDVCFVGGRYGIRDKIVSSLRRAGIRVAAYGSGWEQGRVAVEEVPRLFAQSRVVLGIGTIGHCEDFYALKLRDFDGPMSGSLYVTHDNPDLRGLYEIGSEIETYRSVHDCVEKVRCYLRDAETRERIARAGRARAVRDHTWDKRFSDFFAMLAHTSGHRRSLVHSHES